MSNDPRRALKHLGPAILLAVALGAALASGCAKEPEAPTWDNPFDPSGSGDPFHVRAVLSGHAVVVTWDIPSIPDLAGFDVVRSLDGETYFLAGKVGATVASYSDAGYAANHINYYKVRARNAAGEVSATSRVVAAQLFAPPALHIIAGASGTSTRHVTLTVRTEVGDTVEISASSDFADAARLPAKPGETDSVAWDLGTASFDGAVKSVWLRIDTGADVSPSVHDSVRTAFHPDLQLAGVPATVATRLQTAVLEGGGVTQLRFAASREDLPLSNWSAPDSTVGENAYFTGMILGADPAQTWLYCESLCDFGFTSVDSVRWVPDDLSSARFTLAGGADLTDNPVVSLVSEAEATEMRFAEGPDLSGTPWQAYADTTSFSLSPGAGLKVVYGQFRNDWYDAVSSDSITFVQTAALRRR